MSEELLTPQEAARYLDISEMTLYRRLKEKDIKPANYNPLLKRQKEPRYRKSDLDKLRAEYVKAA